MWGTDLFLGYKTITFTCSLFLFPERALLSHYATLLYMYLTLPFIGAPTEPMTKQFLQHSRYQIFQMQAHDTATISLSTQLSKSKTSKTCNQNFAQTSSS